MTRKQRRFTLIAGSVAVLAIAVTLMFTALGDATLFFQTPSQAAAKGTPPGTRFRLGGLVEKGSVQPVGNGSVRFVVADGAAKLPVVFRGVLPDLFRDGQGVIADGAIAADGSFAADTVLAKHDENYMPREVADALKAQGVWQADTGKTP